MAVHRIELPTPFAVGPVNAYLLDGEPLTLVDCGPRSPEAQAALEAGLAAAGRRIEDIRRLILTHGHTDHFGNARWIQERSGAEVLAHPADGPKLAGERWMGDHLRRFFAEAGLPATFPESFAEMLGRYRVFFDPLATFTPLRDGDEIAAGESRLRVLHCPGHSAGHICLVDDTGALIAGDLLLAGVSPNPIVEFAGDGSRIATLPQYLHSLRRILLLNCAPAYPGHGAPLPNPGARIRELLAHHERRKEELLRRLADGPQTLLALCQALYGDLDHVNLMLGLSEIVGHLDLLVAERKVTSSRKGGQVFYRAS